MNDDFLTDEKQYSIVHRDRWKPFGHSDEEVKVGESDDLGDVPLPNLTGISILAYDAEGNMYELSGRDKDDDVRERFVGVVNEVETDE